MKFLSDKKITFVLSLAIAALIAVLVIFFLSNKKVKSTSDTVTHTQDVLQKSDHILLDILNIETGARGYLLTVNEIFLDPLIKAETTIHTDLSSLTTITQDNPNQQVRIDFLKKLAEERLVLAKKMVAEKRQNRLSELEIINNLEKGKIITDQIKATITAIKVEEFGLLRNRKIENEKSNKNSNAIFFVLLSFLLAIVALVALIIRNQKIRNNELEAFTSSQNSLSNYTRSLIEASLDPLVTISATGKILDVNEASVKVTGVLREKLIDTDFSNYFTEPTKAQEGYLQVFEKGFVADYPLTIKHKNGNLTDVLYNASVYKDDKGNVLGVFAAARDVTEQKWAKDLRIANKELAFQNDEKEKRAAELGIANKELIFQNDQKEKRAAELGVANKKLVFENEEKEKRAAELVIANKELAFQNAEKEKRAAELIIANKELVFQNEEKEKRAAELIIANKELAFQNEEKEKRAAELIIANEELAFQNAEKEKRAAELIIANKELVFQNKEKEKRAAELGIANKELESFTYISSHDLQEPLRKIQIFATRLIADESKNLSDKGKEYVLRMQYAANRMQVLITDLLAYSRTTTSERKFEKSDLNAIIESVKKDFAETIAEKKAIINVNEMCDADIIPFQFRQLMHNIIGNALKFSKPDLPPQILIKSRIIKGSKVHNQKLLSEEEYCHITVTDNGIGFEPQYKDHIFELFKRLHDKEKITGTGIGLTIVKKIAENHNGVVTATSELNKGATFDIYIPST